MSLGEVCQLCDRPTTHIGPCDGFGYLGECAMCSHFVEREDGTLIHENGTIFAPVKAIQEVSYEVQLPQVPRKEIENAVQ